MSELDELNDFYKEMEEYNRVQLRQTLDFFKDFKSLITPPKEENNAEDLKDFEEGWIGIKDLEEQFKSFNM